MPQRKEDQKPETDCLDNWFHYRAGRITASQFKAAASTDPAYPSQLFISQSRHCSEIASA